MYTYIYIYIYILLLLYYYYYLILYNIINMSYIFIASYIHIYLYNMLTKVWAPVPGTGPFGLVTALGGYQDS